jgi:hypothetical protein
MAARYFEPDAAMSQAERREAKIEFLIEQAKESGDHLTREDFEHEDVDDLLDESYMTDEQIAKLEEYENKARERMAALHPPVATPLNPAPREAGHTYVAPTDGCPNVVREDAIFSGRLSEQLMTQLVAYAPVERLIALVGSWRIQERRFASHEAFTAQLTRFGCTCITRPANKNGGLCEYTLDAYYQQKKEDAAKKRRRQKEIRTATSVARMAARMSGIVRAADSRAPMNAGGSDSDDDETARERAMRAAGGSDGSLFTPNNAEVVELDEIPAFADDHVQMQVKLRRVPGSSELVVEDLRFVVRDVEY